MNIDKRLLYMGVVILGVALIVGHSFGLWNKKETSEYKSLSSERGKKIAEMEQRVGEMSGSLQMIKQEREKIVANLTQNQKQLLNQLNTAEGDRIKLNEIIESHQNQAEEYQEMIAELTKTYQDLRNRNNTLLTRISAPEAHCQELVAGQTQLTRQINLCWPQRVPCFASLPWDTCEKGEIR